MNFFEIVGKLLGLVSPVVDAVTSIAQAASPKTKGKPHPRTHHWAQGNRCVYCRVSRTLANEQELCPEGSV